LNFSFLVYVPACEEEACRRYSSSACCLIGIAYLSGYFSPRQPQTVALDVGFSGIRFSLVLLNLFWVQELVAREIDRRIDPLLAGLSGFARRFPGRALRCRSWSCRCWRQSFWAFFCCWRWS
jgi:hypothetical protein